MTMSPPIRATSPGSRAKRSSLPRAGGMVIKARMRRVPESELETDFERQYGWGDDERYLYNRNRRKASVFGHMLRIEEVLRLVRQYSPGRRVADLASAQGNFGLM